MRIGALLFVFVAAIYVLTGSGHVQTIDVFQTVEVAQHMVDDGSVTIDGPAIPGGGAVAGKDGRLYAAHGIGMSLLFLPVAVMRHFTHAGLRTPVTEFEVSLLDPIAAALTVLVLYLFARDLGVGAVASAATALAFAFATIEWSYAHYAFDAAPAGLFLLLGFWLLWRATRRLGLRLRLRLGLWALSGVAFGFAVLIRVDSALALPFAGVALLAWHWPAIRRLEVGRPARAAVAWTAPVLVALAVNSWFNVLRFGHPFDDGHGGDPNTKMTTPLLHGLDGLLFSPGKSMLAYSPVILLGLMGAVLVAKTPGKRIAVAAMFGTGAAFVIFHARLENWAGDEAIGPRFVVPATALFVVSAAFFFVRWRTLRLPLKALAVILVGAGFSVQVLSWSVDYLAVKRKVDVNISDLAWSHDRSQLLLQTRALRLSLQGEEPYPDSTNGGVVAAPVPHFDVWLVAFRIRHYHRSAATVGAIALIAVAIASGIGLVRGLRGHQSGPAGDDDPSPARREPGTPTVLAHAVRGDG